MTDGRTRPGSGGMREQHADETALHRSIMDQGGAQEQVILPARVAFRIAVTGIRTRLGRSLVTLSGVTLGITFLASVLGGFHVKSSLREDTARLREVSRRVAVLRSEVGALSGKTVLVAGEGLSPVDLAFQAALGRHGAKLLARGAEGAAAVDLALLLGDYSALAGSGFAEAHQERVLFAFGSPDAALAAEFARHGATLRQLGVELPEDERRRAELRETRARHRMFWIVGVSLLITVGGITNSMLMSVTERFREIATMKCLGALSSFVVKLFLIETSLIGFAGAVVGALVGLIFPMFAYSWTFGIGRVLAAVDFGVVAAFSAACVTAGVVLAVLAGIYPAKVAARMVPADALRTQV